MHGLNSRKLIDDIRTGSSRVRNSATNTLRELGPAAKEAVPSLVDLLLTEKQQSIRECAVSILMYIGDAGAAARPSLLKILKDPHEDRKIRNMAAGAIAEMGPSSLAALCECLKDPDPFLRKAAADGFYRMGSTGIGSLSALIEALGDDDGAVSGCVRSALIEMGDGVLPSLHQSLDRLEGRGRLDACKVILAMTPDDHQAILALRQELNQSDPAVRRDVVSFVHSLVEQSSDQFFHDIEPTDQLKNPFWKTLIPSLLQALNDPDSEVRYWAAAALGELRSDADQVIPHLTKCLHDANEQVRKAAARALADYQDRAAPALKDLMHLLEVDVSEVQLAAIYAIGQIGPRARQAVPLIQKVMKTNDKELRTRAKDALRRIKKQ